MLLSHIKSTDRTERVHPVRRILSRISPLFALTVLLPTALAVVYFGFLASDVYVSESKYIVRTQGKQAPSGLASLLVGGDVAGLSGSAISAVAEYAASRDAMTALNDRGQLNQMYNRPEVTWFDRLQLFGATKREDLYSFFSKHVSLNQDNQTSITTLVVKAYRPEDARWINERLLTLGEGLVNRLNDRSRIDLVRYAQQEVKDAKEQVRVTALALAQYRNEHAVIDPEKQAGVSLQMISKLQDDLIATRTQVMQIRAFAPNNPQLPVLQARIASLTKEMKIETGKLTGTSGSLAAKTADYTRLALDSEYAEKLLANALVSLQSANNDARRQQVYVERIVQPNLPDKAHEPRRLRGILSVLVLGLVAWGVLKMLFSAMLEHNA